MYDNVYSEAIQPLAENGFIFSKGLTKISVDDKAAIPIGEPNQPIRSNVQAMCAALTHNQSKDQPNAMDHDFH